jgi:hypothetical protein
VALLNSVAVRKINRQFDAIRELDPEALISSHERHRHSVKDVHPGGFIRFSGKTYLVEEMGTYRETSDNFAQETENEWPELKLFCLDTGDTAYLEWEEDDELSVSLTTEALRLAELKDDADEAIDGDDLEDLANDDESLFVRGKEFQYEDDYAASYRGGDDSKGEHVYLYEFVADDGLCLTVEEWVVDSAGEKYEYRAYLSSDVDPDAIDILVSNQSS